MKAALGVGLVGLWASSDLQVMAVLSPVQLIPSSSYGPGKLASVLLTLVFPCEPLNLCPRCTEIIS